MRYNSRKKNHRRTNVTNYNPIENDLAGFPVPGLLARAPSSHSRRGLWVLISLNLRKYAYIIYLLEFLNLES